MNQERDKYLTEAMGECWHEPLKGIEKLITGSDPHLCYKCGHRIADYYSWTVSHDNTDFSTWGGFGKLWEWAITQEWWFKFMHQYLGNSWNTEWKVKDLITPDRFADAVYEFLKKEV